MLSLLWTLIIVLALLISIPIVRYLRKHKRARQILKRNTPVNPVPNVPRETHTAPICVWHVYSQEDVLTAEPLAYKDAHNVARMYALQWYLKGKVEFFPIQVRDVYGEVACTYDWNRAALLPLSPNA